MSNNSSEEITNGNKTDEHDPSISPGDLLSENGHKEGADEDDSRRDKKHKKKVCTKIYAFSVYFFGKLLSPIHTNKTILSYRTAIEVRIEKKIVGEIVKSDAKIVVMIKTNPPPVAL